MLKDGPSDSGTLLILAHGAGAGADAPVLESIASGVGAAGIAVWRFEFPYMQRIRAEGKRRPPDRMPVLADALREVVNGHAADRLVIGGRSMGGRVASMLADELGADGLICLGYPFHPPAKPDRPRTAHLKDLATPTVIFQGTRDPFGDRKDVDSYDLSPAIRLVWLEDGDHGFKPRKASGFTLDQHLQTVIDETVAFCRILGQGGRAD